jgi:hypothetical protein
VIGQSHDRFGQELDQADAAYKLFDKQSDGKGVFLL